MALFGSAATNAGVCPVPGGSGTIAGRVTSAATGDGVIGIQVVAEIDGGGFLVGVALATTDVDGDYQFAGLVPAVYFVRTQSTPLLVDEVWQNVACEELCEPAVVGTAVPVAAGGSVPGIDFALDQGGRLEGFVRLADGTTPAPDSRVEVFRLGPIGTAGLGAVEAGPDGSWALEGLETASYKVRALGPALLAEVFPDAPCPTFCDVFGSGDPIAVVAGTTTSGIDLALAAGGSISGAVTDLAAAPIAGVNVSLRNAANNRLVRAQTGVGGSWTSDEGLVADTYFALTSSEHTDELWDNRPCEPFCTPSTGDPIVVSAGGAVPGINFALARRGAIAGTITESGTSLPLRDAAVVVRDSGGQFAGFGISNAAGDYRVGGLVQGFYLVVVIDGVHVGEIYDDAGVCYDPFTCLPSGAATPVPVIGSGETPAIDFELDPGGVVQGAVVVEGSNAPISEAAVTLFSLAGIPETTGFSTTDGRFRLGGIPAGISYRVRALPPAGSPLEGEVWQEQPCDPDNCPPDVGTPVPVALGAPACVAFTLTAPPVGTGISGVVTGDGVPLPGVQVAIFDASGTPLGTVATESDGGYVTTGVLELTAGVHFVVANGILGFDTELFDDILCAACDPTTGTPVVVVQDSTTDDVDFDLEGGTPPTFGTVTGRVTNTSNGLGIPRIHVQLWGPAGQALGFAETDDHGLYSLGVPAGTVFANTSDVRYLAIKHRNEAWQERMCQPSCSPWVMGTPISVVATETTPGIDFTLNRGLVFGSGFENGALTDWSDAEP